MPSDPQQKPFNLDDYLQLWQKYSCDLPSGILDVQVARNALQAGQHPKEVALMLVVGSPIVKQLYQTRGKQNAMKYAQHVVQGAMNQLMTHPSRLRKVKQVELELGD